jgi:hypothetical protein
VVNVIADGVIADESYDGLDMEKVIFEAIQNNLK